MLTHNGLDAWLQDRRGRVIKHTKPTIDRNKVTAVIHIEPKSLYTVPWRCSPKAKPISAWCQIFNSSTVGGTATRVAHTYMDETRDATQSRTSKGVLELPLERFGQLRVPPEGLGSVWLEIRRTRGPPIEQDLNDSEDSEGEAAICEVDMDLLDDPTENKSPWVILQFDFKKPATEMNSPHPPSEGSESDEETSDDIHVDLPRLRKNPAQVQRNCATHRSPTNSSSQSRTSTKRTKVPRPQVPAKRKRTSNTQTSADIDIQAQLEVLNEEERQLEKALAKSYKPKRKGLKHCVDCSITTESSIRTRVKTNSSS